MSETAQLDFYFDVLCPFAWRTSLWMRQVAQQRAVVVTWKQFSLAIVNDAKPESDFWRKDLALGRLFIAAERLGGNEAVDRLYLALGDALHGRQLDPLDESVLAGALTYAGLIPELHTAAWDDETTERDYLASHDEALTKGGMGVPTLVLDGSPGYFGPVIDPIPTGEQALELWDFTRWAIQQPYLWELKRERAGALRPQPADPPLSDQTTAGPESDADVAACVWTPAG